MLLFIISLFAPIAQKLCLLPCQLLPAVNNHVHISRVKLHQICIALVLLAAHNRRPAAAKQIQNRVTLLGAVLDLIVK